MAVMDTVGKARAWINALRAIGNEVDIGDAAVRDAVLAAVGAADNWVDANQASYVTDLPEPFKSWSTSRQKAAVLAFVLHERFNVGTE